MEIDDYGYLYNCGEVEEGCYGVGGMEGVNILL